MMLHHHTGWAVCSSVVSAFPGGQVAHPEQKIEEIEENGENEERKEDKEKRRKGNQKISDDKHRSE